MDIRQRSRLLRIKQFIPHILPISVSGFWAGIKKGTYPPGLKLSERVTVWPESQIIAIAEGRDWRTANDQEAL